MTTDRHDGMFGASDAAESCADCGAEWSAGERLHTGDDRGIGGWEDWRHCRACGCEMFFPVVHRPTATIPPALPGPEG